MKRFNIALVISLVLVIISCEKSNDTVKVTYLISGLQNEFKYAYLDENENTISGVFDPISVNDEWKIEFNGNPGDILYLYLSTEEVISNSVEFKFRILLDGKVYKEAYFYDKEDASSGTPQYYIKRNGIIPYDYHGN